MGEDLQEKVEETGRAKAYKRRGSMTRYANREYSQPVRSANVHASRLLEARVSRVEGQLKSFQERHLRRLYDMRHLSKTILLKSQDFVEGDFRCPPASEGQDPVSLPELRGVAGQTAPSPPAPLHSPSPLSPRSPTPSLTGFAAEKSSPTATHGRIFEFPASVSPRGCLATVGRTSPTLPGRRSPAAPLPTRTWRLRHAACTRESRSFRVLRSKYAALEVRDPDVHLLLKQHMRDQESRNRHRLLKRVHQMCHDTPAGR